MMPRLQAQRAERQTGTQSWQWRYANRRSVEKVDARRRTMDRYGEVIHKIFFFFKHCLENLNFCQLKTRTFFSLPFLILILLVGCRWLAALLLKGCMFYVPQYDSLLSFIHCSALQWPKVSRFPNLREHGGFINYSVLIFITSLTHFLSLTHCLNFSVSGTRAIPAALQLCLGLCLCLRA